MEKTKTIKEIMENLAGKITNSECGFYDRNEEFVKQSLISLLEEVESKLPKTCNEVTENYRGDVVEMIYKLKKELN